MENLNFLFKQTRQAKTIDNTLGYPENPVCKISSSSEGNYVYFNNRVLNQFELNVNEEYFAVFGLNPDTEKVTFAIFSVEGNDMSKFPVSATAKLQKGPLKDGIIRFTSKPAIKILADIQKGLNDEGQEVDFWYENVFNVEVSETENGQKYMTIGDALINDEDYIEEELEELGL